MTSAMGGLLARQARRRGFHRTLGWTMFSVLLFMAPAATAAFTEAAFLRTFLYVLAFMMALIVPLVQLAADASLLVGLRRSGSLDDLLLTRTPASEIVDQVAAYSVQAVLRMGAAVLVPVLVGLLLVVPAGQRAGVLWGSLLWLPGVALLVWAGSMLVQAVVAWSSDADDTLPVMAVLALPVVAGLVLLLRQVAAFAGADQYAQASGLAAALLAAVGLTGRWLASRGLGRAGRGAVCRPRRGGPRTALRSGPENPIVMREVARSRGARFPGGRFRLVSTGLRFWLPGVGLALLGVQLVASGFLGGFLLLGLLGFVQPVRASLSTLGAVLQERDRCTLETMALTGITPRDFVDGWARAALVPLLLETTILLLLASLFGGAAGPLVGVALVAAGLLDLFLKMAGGAYLGLVVSGYARARRDAVVVLLLCWVFGSVGLAIVFGLGAGLMLAMTMPIDSVAAPDRLMAAQWLLALPMALGVPLILRAVALRRVEALFRAP